MIGRRKQVTTGRGGMGPGVVAARIRGSTAYLLWEAIQHGAGRGCARHVRRTWTALADRVRQSYQVVLIGVAR